MRVLSPREVGVRLYRAGEDALHAEALAGQRLLQPEPGVPAVELELRHLIVDPRRVVLQAPVDLGVAHAGRPSQRAPDPARGPRPAGDDDPALVRVEWVAERRADRLPDRGAHAGPLRERQLRQVGVVDVAREDADG